MINGLVCELLKNEDVDTISIQSSLSNRLISSKSQNISLKTTAVLLNTDENVGCC